MVKQCKSFEMNKKQYVLNCDMFEMQGPTFKMKSVALSFAMILCTLCHKVLLVHVHQVEASGLQPGKPVHHFLRTDRDVPVNVH